MNRRTFLGGVAASALAPAAALCATPAPIDVVEKFGFVGDGRTDNYEAFHRWAAYVNAQKGGNYFFAPGTYYVARYRTTSYASKVASEVRNAPLVDCRNLTITGDRAVIRLNGKFHRSIRKGRDGIEI